MVIFQLQNEITSLKRSKREGKKPIKKKNTSHQIPPTSGINLEDYVMDKFFVHIIQIIQRIFFQSL